MNSVKTQRLTDGQTNEYGLSIDGLTISRLAPADHSRPAPLAAVDLSTKE
jgi:hypothetical protein